MLSIVGSPCAIRHIELEEEFWAGSVVFGKDCGYVIDPQEIVDPLAMRPSKRAVMPASNYHFAVRAVVQGREVHQNTVLILFARRPSILLAHFAGPYDFRVIVLAEQTEM